MVSHSILYPVSNTPYPHPVPSPIPLPLIFIPVFSPQVKYTIQNIVSQVFLFLLHIYIQNKLHYCFPLIVLFNCNYKFKKQLNGNQTKNLILFHSVNPYFKLL